MSLGSGQGIDGQFAMDMQGLRRLRHSAQQDQAGSARDAAQQFEALFLQMMVKSMRDAVPTAGLLDNQQSEFFQEMLDKQWSQTMASRGIGLADRLVAELESSGMVPRAQDNREAELGALIAGIPRGAPQPLRDAIHEGGIDDETAKSGDPGEQDGY